MTDAERRKAEISSIIKTAVGEQPKETSKAEPKKPAKKQSKKAKEAK